MATWYAMRACSACRHPVGEDGVHVVTGVEFCLPCGVRIAALLREWAKRLPAAPGEGQD